MAKHGAKVTADDVRDIRERHTAGLTIKQLAFRYKLSLRAIKRIVRHESWAEVKPKDSGIMYSDALLNNEWEEL